MLSVVSSRSRVHVPASRPVGNVISVHDLPALLSSRPGCQVVTIVARTAPRMNKTGNPFYGRLEKLSRVNGMIGWQYESCVNRQREREGVSVPFVAEARKWGQRLAGTPLVEHKGTLYLELKVERSLACEYLLDGKACDKATVGDWLKESSGESRQGVEREVILRDYKLSSIVQVTIGGTVYTVEHDEPAASSFAPLAKAA